LASRTLLRQHPSLGWLRVGKVNALDRAQKLVDDLIDRCLLQMILAEFEILGWSILDRLLTLLCLDEILQGEVENGTCLLDG
jgi:hypothetical protein